jgi:hypothetical protein
VPRAVLGIGKKLEVGVNVAVVDAFAPEQSIYISPNVKWQAYSDEEDGVALAAGGLLYTPIAHRVGADTYGFVYAVVSKRFNTGIQKLLSESPPESYRPQSVDASYPAYKEPLCESSRLRKIYEQQKIINYTNPLDRRRLLVSWSTAG